MRIAVALVLLLTIAAVAIPAAAEDHEVRSFAGQRHRHLARHPRAESGDHRELPSQKHGSSRCAIGALIV